MLGILPSEMTNHLSHTTDLPVDMSKLDEEDQLYLREVYTRVVSEFGMLYARYINAQEMS